MNLPDSDWTIAGKIRNNVSSGLDGGYYEGTGSSGATIAIGTFADGKVFVFLADDDGTEIYVESATTPLNNTNQHALIVERSGTTITLYVDGVSVANASDAGLDALTLNATNRFGMYNDGSNHFLNGVLADFAKWNRTLSASDKTAYSTYSSNCFPGAAWLPPMIRDYNEIVAGIAVTNNGSTVTAHPRLYNCN